MSANGTGEGGGPRGMSRGCQPARRPVEGRFDKITPLIGSRVDPVTGAPIDKWKQYNTFRLILQIVI